MTQGHDRTVDYWTFGVVLHELLTGCNPFVRAGEKSKVDVFKRIVRAQYSIPPTITGGFASVDILKKLLVSNPDLRLGSQGIDNIRQHDFFTGMDFSLLLKKELSPPWIPILKNETSVCYDHFYGSNSNAAIRMEDPAKRQLTKSEQLLFREF